MSRISLSGHCWGEKLDTPSSESSLVPQPHTSKSRHGSNWEPLCVTHNVDRSLENKTCKCSHGRAHTLAMGSWVQACDSCSEVLLHFTFTHFTHRPECDDGFLPKMFSFLGPFPSTVSCNRHLCRSSHQLWKRKKTSHLENCSLHRINSLEISVIPRALMSLKAEHHARVA